LGSFVRLSQRALGQDAGQMTLKLLAGMDAAAWVDGFLNKRSRLVDLFAADLRPGERATRFNGQDWDLSGIAKRDPGFGAPLSRVELDGASDPDQGEITPAPRHFHETRA
jgi:hypothetical protein